MPAIAQKAKALGGKGVVLSYVDKPENFYWREQVPGTKRYLHRLLPNSSTLEEAVEECIEAYTALRQEQAVPHGSDGTSQQRASESQGRATRNSNAGRFKNRPVEACVAEFLEAEQRKVEAELLKPRSLLNKRQALLKQMLPYLAEKGVTHTRQIDLNTFEDYPTWRKAAKSTRKLELTYIGNFLNEFCKRRGLLDIEVSPREALPSIAIKDSEVDANPPLIEQGNWQKVVVALSRNRDRAAQLRNHRGSYFAQLFYRWCIVGRNSGLRPDIELNKLRWCDVRRENVGRWSKSEEKKKDKWIAVLHVRNSKTGKQRIIPTNGVDNQLTQWKEEQQQYIQKYCPGIEVTDETLIFGNPHNEMRQYAYNNFNRTWRKVIDEINPALKPYVFSEKNYTPYSLRSTYICNLILDDKDIYTVAKLAGHTIAVCEKYYARIDMGQKAKEITDFDYGSTRSRNIETESY